MIGLGKMLYFALESNTCKRLLTSGPILRNLHGTGGTVKGWAGHAHNHNTVKNYCTAPGYRLQYQQKEQDGGRNTAPPNAQQKKDRGRGQWGN